MKRKGLSLRRKTTVSQATSANCIPKLVSFITRLRALQIQHSYPPETIFAMDETACWMDMLSDTTVALTGKRSVPLKSTGHEKNHFTVVLTARADGTKMKPFVVFKGKGTQLVKDLQQIPGIVVRLSSNGWMNDSLPLTSTALLVPSHSPNDFLYGMHTVGTPVQLFEQKQHVYVCTH